MLRYTGTGDKGGKCYDRICHGIITGALAGAVSGLGLVGLNIYNGTDYETVMYVAELGVFYTMVGAGVGGFLTGAIELLTGSRNNE